MRNQIRRFRKEKGLTLAQVADRLGTTPQTVSRLETEVMTLTMDWLQRFADLFEIHPADLLDVPDARNLTHLGSLDSTGRLSASGLERFNLAVPVQNGVAVRLSNAVGPYAAGDILIANRFEGPSMENAAGYDGLAAILNGPVLLRRIIQGEGGLFTLVPFAPGQVTVRNASLTWAAKVVMRVSYF